MNLKLLQKKLANLTLIHKILESKKNIILINILNLAKQNSYYFQRSINSKNYLEQLATNYKVPFLENHYNTSQNKLWKKSKNQANKRFPTLWVYVTEVEKFATNSYYKHEQTLLNYADFSKDLFVAIGLKATTFLQAQKARIVFQQDSNNVAYLANLLPRFLENFLIENQGYDVNFVLNSAKLKTPYLTIFPIQAINFAFMQRSDYVETTWDLQKLTIYPDLDAFITAEFFSYLTYICLTLLSESALIYEKYKLVNQNKLLNDVEAKIKFMHREVLKTKNELQVEQISLLSKHKNLLHTVPTNKK